MTVRRIVPDLAAADPASARRFRGDFPGLDEAGLEIACGPADEPWGVRRFFVRDPSGRLVNALSPASGAGA
jgi:uncharacterized glyoxalase superfamily protein PhnB